MGRARVYTVVLLGADGHLLEIHADLTGADVLIDAATTTRGSGCDSAVAPFGSRVVGVPVHTSPETRDRLRAAILNSGLCWPHEPITLTAKVTPPAATAATTRATALPATTPSELALTSAVGALAPWQAAGSTTDLALACAMLAVTDTITPTTLDDTVLLGELSLDGRLRPARNVLAALLAAHRAGMHRAVIPAAALDGVPFLPGIEMHGAETLVQALAIMHGHPNL